MFGFELSYTREKEEKLKTTDKSILLIKNDKAFLIKGEEPKEEGRWSMKKRGAYYEN